MTMASKGCCHHLGGRFIRDRIQFLKQRLFRSLPIADNGFCGQAEYSKMPLSTPPWVGRNIDDPFVCKARESQQNYQHNRYVHRRFSSSTKTSEPSPFQLCKNSVTSSIDHLQNNRVTTERSFSSKQGSNGIIVNHNENSTGPLISFSSVTETPLDSTVMEKPYTVVLMEDDISPSFFYGGKEYLQGENDAIELSSWAEIFRSRSRRDYGMSFASISLQMKFDSTTARTATISDALEALKASSLPHMADALLVARGPLSALCAQYYLESFPLKGLIMIDPILFEGSDSSDETALFSFVANQVYPNDTDSLDRFLSERLLVEPNAVPMMVVRTISEERGLVEWSAAWRSCSQRVADRHGDHEGPYGTVSVVDMVERTTTDDKDDDMLATLLLEHINRWVEEDLQW